MKLTEGATTCSIGGQDFLMPGTAINGGKTGVIRLNETGLFLCTCLSEETSEEELIEKMKARYDISEADVAGDVRRFLAALRGYGVLTG